MTSALHAEWTKLRTVPAPLWLLLGAIAATVALSAAVTAVATCASAVCGGDPVGLSLAGVQLGQAPVAVLGVLVIGGEYGTGMITTTLAATPHRSTVLAAKAVTLTGAVTVAGTVAVLGSLLAGRLILPEPLPLADGPALRAAAGSIVHLVLIALLSLGVAAVLRDAATGTGTVLGLLYVFPLLAQVIGDPQWQRLLQRIGPASAGLGVTAGWAAAALVAAALLLRIRDA
ncbi:ABC transporter permease [Actinomadura sp. 3N508]|uniref:ABC transporter permease n=1 Tax=Actinomadura sp. 3N508 TaxID=3375153 RepID=UPI0037B4F4B1